MLLIVSLYTTYHLLPTAYLPAYYDDTPDNAWNLALPVTSHLLSKSHLINLLWWFLILSLNAIIPFFSSEWSLWLVAGIQLLTPCSTEQLPSHGPKTKCSSSTGYIRLNIPTPNDWCITCASRQDSNLRRHNNARATTSPPLASRAQESQFNAANH